MRAMVASATLAVTSFAGTVVLPATAAAFAAVLAAVVPLWEPEGGAEELVVGSQAALTAATNSFDHFLELLSESHLLNAKGQ